MLVKSPGQVEITNSVGRGTVPGLPAWVALKRSLLPAVGKIGSLYDAQLPAGMFSCGWADRLSVCEVQIAVGWAVPQAPGATTFTVTVAMLERPTELCACTL